MFKGSYCACGQCKPCCASGETQICLSHIHRHHQAWLLSAETELNERMCPQWKNIFVIKTTHCVVKVGQRPLSRLELSWWALSPRSAEQWRAVIYPSALYVCVLQHGESTFLPSTSQMSAEVQLALWPAGWPSPWWLFYWRPLGFSNPKRNFYAFLNGSRVWGFFVVVVMILLVSSFIPQKKS